MQSVEQNTMKTPANELPLNPSGLEPREVEELVHQLFYLGLCKRAEPLKMKNKDEVGDDPCAQTALGIVRRVYGEYEGQINKLQISVSAHLGDVLNSPAEQYRFILDLSERIKASLPLALSQTTWAGIPYQVWSGDARIAAIVLTALNFERARRVQTELSESLLKREGVSSVGLVYDQEQNLGIEVGFEENRYRDRTNIPKNYKGFDVTSIVTGRIELQ